MRKNKNSVLIAVLVSLVACVIVGCNTIEGFGEDLSSGGDTISNTARDTNPDR